MYPFSNAVSLECPAVAPVVVHFPSAVRAVQQPEKEHLKKGIRNRPPKIRRFYVKDIQIVF